MSQAHIKTINGWLPDVRKETTIGMGTQMLVSQLAAVENAEELQQIVKLIAAREYGTVTQALTENTPYKTGTASGAGT